MQTVAVQPLNAVVGDAGFIAQYGRLPASTDGSVSRIRAHLAFVEERLRKATAAYPPEVAERRLRHLDTLAAYREAGVFPRITEEDMASLEAMRSLDGVQRLPCFIDRAGTHCAVGHLMARSGEEGPAVSEAMDGAHHWDYLLEVDASRLPESVQAWVASCGFSLTELAMIQPTYDFDRMPISPTPITPPPSLPVTVTFSPVPAARHERVRCDRCSMMPIIGTRFKCTNCPDYDLCEECEAMNEHDGRHVFLKIRRPVTVAGGGPVPAPVLPCSHCNVAIGIRDVRYRCSECEGVVLCAFCEPSDVHDTTHILLKIRTSAADDLDPRDSNTILPEDPPEARVCADCRDWLASLPPTGPQTTVELCSLCNDNHVSKNAGNRFQHCCDTCSIAQNVCATCGVTCPEE